MNPEFQKAASFSRDFCDSRRGLRKLTVYEGRQKSKMTTCAAVVLLGSLAVRFYFFVQKMWLDKPMGRFRWPAKNGRNAIELCVPSKIFSNLEKKINKND